MPHLSMSLSQRPTTQAMTCHHQVAWAVELLHTCPNNNSHQLTCPSSSSHQRTCLNSSNHQRTFQNSSNHLRTCHPSSPLTCPSSNNPQRTCLPSSPSTYKNSLQSPQVNNSGSPYTPKQTQSIRASQLLTMENPKPMLTLSATRSMVCQCHPKSKVFQFTILHRS